MHRDVYHYEYVERAYGDVSRYLCEHTAEALGVAAAQMHVTIGHLDVSRPIAIEVEAVAPGEDRSVIRLRWHAREHEHLFPTMVGEIDITPLANRPPLTQLSVIATYHAPLGVFGALGDEIGGHRLVAESVRRFVRDLVRHVESTLTEAVRATG